MPLVSATPAGLPSATMPGSSARRTALAMGIAQSAGVAIEHAQLYARAREVGVVEERNRLAREVHDTLAQG